MIAQQQQLLNPTDPILLHSGDLLQKETDLKIPGRGMDYEFVRTYRSRIEYDGPLGFGWDHNYNKRLVFQENGNVARFDGQARFDIYVKNADETFVSPSGYFDTLVVVKDSENKIAGATIKDKNGTVNTYGADGLINEIKDRNGNVMAFAYEAVTDPLLCKEGVGEVDRCKRLKTVTDTIGRAIEYAYNASGKLAELKDFSGRIVKFEYNNPQGDLIAVTNPAGHTTRYTYSSGFGDDRSELNHNLLTVTDAKGQTYLKNTYSIYDRVVKQTFGDEGNFVIEYNQVASSLECTDDLKDKIFYRTNVTDRKGNKFDYLFNCQGNPLEVKRGGFVTKYAYNKDGLMTKLTKPKGDATEYDYDAKGNIKMRRQLPATGSTDAPLETKFEYDEAFSRLKKRIVVVDAIAKPPVERVTNFTLDAKGNVTEKCTPSPLEGEGGGEGSICQSYTYTTTGQIESITDGEGNTDTYTYNDEGYLARITRDPPSPLAGEGGGEGYLNLTNDFGYDTRGNLNSFKDGRGNEFTFDVNDLNQVTLEKAPAPLNYERHIDYDANGNVVKISGSAAVETTFTYNILDRLTTKSEKIDGAQTALTEYQYDLNENLTRIVEPEGNSTFIAYNERDLPVSVTKGYRTTESSTRRFVYDGNGNVSSVKDGNGNVTQYQYDGFNRIEKIIDPLSGEMKVAYDEVNNIGSISRRGPPDINVETRFAYDALNRLTQKTEENGDSDAVTKYNYDKNNRLTSVIASVSAAISQETRFIYDGADRLTQKTDPAANQTRYAYDANGNVVSETTVETPSPLEGEGGGEGTTFTNRYEYDTLNRPTKWTDNLGHAYTYDYDSRNNLISTTDPKDTPGLDNGATTGQGNKTRFVYDGLNRMIEKIQDLTSNGAGNGAVTDTIATRYNYDDNGRLTELVDANNHATRFAYDALNRQIGVTLANNATYAKKYDRNSNLIEELQPNGFKTSSIYDSLNRLTRKEIMKTPSPLEGEGGGEGTAVETFSYDTLSRMTEA
ncbi:MAG: DUF6531 domain-containing protein, partial [bacterium]|nr:DUF6531 domain-containing protein [bacterium]